MSFYITTTPEGMHYHHTDEPYSVAVLDSAMRPASAIFSPGCDDFDCAASLQSNFFAIGYWSTYDLTLFDLKSGDLQRTFRFRRVGPIGMFDESGTRLLFKSGSQILLLNVESSDVAQVKGIRALDRLVVANNEVIVPSQKKDELLRISLQTGDVAAVSLPFNATLFDLKQNPHSHHLIAIDRKKGIHCIDTSDWTITWSASFKKILGQDHMGVGQFSGDGNLFGAAVSARGRNYTLVVEANSGRQVNQIESICYGLPFSETLVRDRSTRKNSFLACTLDLATGEKGTTTLSKQDG